VGFPALFERDRWIENLWKLLCPAKIQSAGAAGLTASEGKGSKIKVVPRNLEECLKRLSDDALNCLSSRSLN